jgi:hypothetical protein
MDPQSASMESSDGDNDPFVPNPTPQCPLRQPLSIPSWQILNLSNIDQSICFITGEKLPMMAI